MTPRPLNPSRTAFESNLRDLMTKAKIDNYRQLAAKAGVSQSLIQRTCSGDTQPTVATLKKLANALGVTVDTLIGDTE